MPTTFSMALPAMATTTSPANACDRFRVWMVGWSAVTNQSDTSAAMPLAATSRVTASHSGQRGGSCATLSAAPDAAGARRSAAGRDSPKITSSTTATAVDSALTCGAAGLCEYHATLGRTSAAVASARSTHVSRARDFSKVWVPCLIPPTTNAAPRTSSRLASIEPMIANWTTVSRPARSAKNAMNSSGRLPNALWSTPVAPAPNRSPNCSTLRPTSEASRATAMAELTNASTAFAWA